MFKTIVVLMLTVYHFYLSRDKTIMINFSFISEFYLCLAASLISFSSMSRLVTCVCLSNYF